MWSRIEDEEKRGQFTMLLNKYILIQSIVAGKDYKSLCCTSMGRVLINIWIFLLIHHCRPNRKPPEEKESGYLGHDLRYDCETKD